MKKKQSRPEIDFEKGMIEGWKHILNICKVCIHAHKKEIKELMQELKEKK